MRTRFVCALTALALLLAVAAPAGRAQPPKSSPDEDAIVKNAEAFHKAFEAGDAKAVANFWTADGDYVDLKGKHLKGRAAIEKAFAEFFAENKGLKLRINITSLRVLTPDLAVEDGTTEVIPPDGGPPSRARYTIVHVKKDGQWLLCSVRDAPYTPPSNYDNLKGLEWAVGSWSGEGDKGDAEHLTLSWTENQNFLTASFSASVKGVSVGSATHWIGLDPEAKRIRSWIFDAAGGFGEGSWTKDGDRWVIKTSSVRQDGKKATATIVLGRGDANTLTLQAKDRTVGGEAIPDTKEFKLKRVD